MKPQAVLLSAIVFPAIFFLACVQTPAPYKPGVGELMNSVQLHHAKPWFADENQNWLLAAYNQRLMRNAFNRMQAVQ
jgi:hypothetical protein